ncbi:MAG TPA: SDR family oxidoreductase, partial [Vicinamibacteria bacterium]|nr:SDR family oxidoreductase [Vicinamibacteria bacterium]
GGIGLALAEHLAGRVRARLVLLGRSGRGASDQRVREGIRRCEALGAEVLVVAADVADREGLRRALAEARARFGRIHGVLHCAGVADRGGVIHRRDRASLASVLRPKVEGTRLLLEELADDPPDLFVLAASLGAAIPESKFGQVAYAAANEFLDAFATAHAGAAGPRTLAIDWSDWHEVGMSVEARRRMLEDGGRPDGFARWFSDHVAPLTENLSNAEALAAFDRALASGLPRVLVSPEDLGELATAFRRLTAERASAAPERPRRPRPPLLGPATPPLGTMESRLVGEWQTFFGIETIGVEDDFFALGGDSLLAVELAERIRAAIGQAVDPHVLAETATVRALAQRLAAQAGAPAPRSVLVTLQRGSGGPPLVLVHPIGGHPLFYRDLVDALGPARPVLAFQARGLVDGEPDTTVEAMAERYLAELDRTPSTQGYALAGASFGGLVAFEMARRLRERGDEVALLAMIDTPGPGRWPEGDPQDDEEARRRITRAAADLGLAEDAWSRPRLLSVWRANWGAMTSFCPRPYDGAVLFFRPREREAGNRLDYHEAWTPLVRTLEIEEVGGDHTTMNRRPHVSRIAERLRRALDAAPALDLREQRPSAR